MHFWVGSLCFLQDRDEIFFPSQVIAISDIITIISDIGNKIPDKSWMLYLLELFNKQKIAIELNLICSFNDDGKFHAIFGGVNQYEFKQIRPIVGHSYLRQIIMNPKINSIIYVLKDITLDRSERFVLPVDEKEFIFEGLNHFTGIEWWNKIANLPYEIRYQVEISHISYGKNDNLADPESISYFPYNQFSPNKDETARQFPISIHQAIVKDRYLCYKINSGICENGLEYSF
ncbi:MAG: hypothetical protein ACREA3_07410 [Nitrosotalea sp.]